MTEQPPRLRDLYNITMECQAASAQSMRAWDWAQQVMPVYLDSCRREVLHEDGQGITAWRNWLNSPASEFLYEVARGEAVEWGLQWLNILLDVSETLIAKCGHLTSERKEEIAREYARTYSGLPHCFPTGFWRDLVELLSDDSPRPSASRLEPVRVSFPLKLSERVFDEVVTDVILGEFVLDTPASATDGIFLHPAQVLTRCLSTDFARSFANAAQALERCFINNGEPFAVRVQIETRKPSHRRFFCGTVLRGGSGGGALALGAFHLLRKMSIGSEVAVSFALTGRETQESDGLCHPIDSGDEKVLGCARQGIKKLIVAQSQQLELGHYGYKNQVEILGAGTIVEAAELVNRFTARSHAVGAPTGSSQSSSDLEGFDGPVPLTSPYYVERETDALFYDAIEHNHSIVLLKAARQMGKSSLLARGLKRAEQGNVRVVSTDFQKLATSDLADQKSFYISIAHLIARQLGLKISLDKTWMDGRSANLNFEAYIEDHVLAADTPIVWAIDEGDRLFSTSFKNDVFALFRSWANERQSRPASCWRYMTMAIAYATEAHLFITDINQSPFNIGTRIELRDFTLGQVSDLNNRYGSRAGRLPLQNEDDLARFYLLVSGHPYLVRRGLFAMVSANMDVRDFEKQAVRDDGPIADHLKRMLMLLMRSDENRQAIRAILAGKPCPSTAAFYNLRSAGVLAGDSAGEAALRCPIYETYLSRHLN